MILYVTMDASEVILHVADIFAILPRFSAEVAKV